MGSSTWRSIRQILVMIGAIIAAITGTTAVSMQGCRKPDVPPSTSSIDPPSNVSPKGEPWAAIGKIQIGTFGCSATVILPRLINGEYDVVAAAHCVPADVRVGVMRLSSGKEFGVRVTAIDHKSDCVWLRTVGDPGPLPGAYLAEAVPKSGEMVWHGGFGEHLPRNLEEGTVTEPLNAKGQTEFLISVSSGDSGGGIVCDKTGKILATVCCTTQRNAKARVWGCSVNSMVELRPKILVSGLEWNPIEVPMMQ